MPSPDPLVAFRRIPAALNREGLNRDDIEQFARILNRKLQAEFTCLITTDAELQRLNRQFRGKDYATDVLSFPGSNELVISYRRAKAQAREFGHSVPDEIRVLMLHGVLHLLGMDHVTDSGQMARRESVWRRKLGLPDGLISRATARVKA
jgi:probable rRNA maturation factor